MSYVDHPLSPVVRRPYLEHRVTTREVNEVMKNRPLVTKPGREQVIEGEQRTSVHAFGTTDRGRRLVVILSLDPNGETAFVVTARPMTKRESADFDRTTQAGEPEEAG